MRIGLDETGYVGHTFERYFKIRPGAGLKGENLPCHCPYCGHVSPQDQFWTKEQIEYAKSVVLRQIMGKFLPELKKFDRRPDPRTFLSVEISVRGRPP